MIILSDLATPQVSGFTPSYQEHSLQGSSVPSFRFLAQTLSEVQSPAVRLFLCKRFAVLSAPTR